MAWWGYSIDANPHGRIMGPAGAPENRIIKVCMGMFECSWACACAFPRPVCAVWTVVVVAHSRGATVQQRAAASTQCALALVFISDDKRVHMCSPWPRATLRAWPAGLACTAHVASDTARGQSRGCCTCTTHTHRGRGAAGRRSLAKALSSSTTRSWLASEASSLASSRTSTTAARTRRAAQLASLQRLGSGRSSITAFRVPSPTGRRRGHKRRRLPCTSGAQASSRTSARATDHESRACA